MWDFIATLGKMVKDTARKLSQDQRSYKSQGNEF
jgi:hypothetical protein